MANYPTNQNDYITIDEEDTELDALRGNDTVTVLASGALIHGGLGDDWLSTTLDVSSVDTDGDGSPDTMNVLTELQGDGGDDRLRVIIEGQPSSAPINITATLDGGDGDDLLWLELRDSGGLLTSVVNGGSGRDTIHISTLTTGDMLGAGGPITVDAGAGDDVVSIFALAEGLFYSNRNTATVSGGDGNDRIESTLKFYDWSGGGSTNTIDGGAGNDTITASADGGGESGTTLNTVHGGAGNDQITVTALGPAVMNLSFTNVVYGDAGNDRIDAWGRNNPADTLESVTASNWLSAGAGNDTLAARLEVRGGYDTTATNELHGGVGDDQLAARLSLIGDGEGTGWNRLYGEDGNDRISARIDLTGEGSDHTPIVAQSELYGGAGADRLSVIGGTGNILDGGAGNDTLAGGAGADLLTGGAGADQLAGAGGADTFAFTEAKGASLNDRDTIADFLRGADRIDVSAIDANPGVAGNQDFSFDASGAGGAGLLWVAEASQGTGSVVFAKAGGQLLVVHLLDGGAVAAEDYTADDFIL